MSREEWISVETSMPSVKYDKYGNWIGERYLLQFADRHFELGIFNPCGNFEEYDGNGIVFVGNALTDDEQFKVVAWQPLPQPFPYTPKNRA